MRRKPLGNPRKKNPSAAQNAKLGFFRIHFGHILLVLSGMVLMALIQIVLDAPTKAAAPPAYSGNKTTPVSEPTVASRHNNAKWGDLAYMPFALDRPQEYFTNEHSFDEKTQWTFKNYDATALRTFFDSLDLESAAKSFLSDTQRWESIPQGFRITPPPQVVTSLKPATRRTLYRVLAQWPENKGQWSPFQFRANGFDQWFADCGLPADKIELVRNMTYEDAGHLYFSDVRAFSQISTHAETMCLVKSLWRVSTFILSVRITPDTDLSPLVEYWGRGGRASEYRPLLQSIQRGGTTDVPVSYFFPAFARLRLFTYPDPRLPRAQREDCFWTAMNFFNDKPDDRFFNTQETLKALQTDYTLLTGADKQFGDALLLVNSQRKALHICTHIADNVVFTKNGGNVAQPWVLMKLDQMLASYDNERPFEVRHYRKKNLPGGPTLAAW